MTMNRLYGVHPVRYALTVPGRVKTLWLQEGRNDQRVKEIVAEAKRQQVECHASSKHRLSQLAGTEKHQGVVAQCHPHELMTLAHLEELLIQKEDDKPALLLLLDNLQDPHNLGACLRSANAASVDAVIIPKSRCAQVNATVHKVSAGGATLTPVITVSSLAKTCQQLKAYNVQCIGLAGEVKKSLYAADYRQPTAFVMGAEETGLSDNIRQYLDDVVHIPMTGQVGSLNVSVATGVVLFETLRQRETK